MLIKLAALCVTWLSLVFVGMAGTAKADAVRAARPDAPDNVTVSAGIGAETSKIIPVSLGSDSNCVSNEAELRAVLALAGKELAGRTICLEPGRYEMAGPDFAGKLTNIPDQAPVTFTSADPENRAVLTLWMMLGDAGGTPNGNVILKGLDFDISSPEVPVGEKGFIGIQAAISLGRGATTRNIVIDDVRVRGTLREARKGGRETEKNLDGIYGTADNLTIRNSLFTRLTDAISISGTNILIEHNRMKENWGDFVQLYGQGNNKSCEDTRGVTIRNNIISDSWSNNRVHPDVVHFFPAYGMSCAVTDVLIEGNIAYLGDTARQPAWPTNQLNMVPVRAPKTIPFRDMQMWRLIGPGDVTLPPAYCPDVPVQMGVQIEPGSQPVTIRPTPGHELRLGPKQTVGQYTLQAEWETWQLLCPGKGANRWELRHIYPVMQGIFSNAIPGPRAYRNITVRHNIFWLNPVHGVSFRDEELDNVQVLNNSLLQPFPGDTDGDGRPNTSADGFNVPFSGPTIFVYGRGTREIRGNISAALYRYDDLPGVMRMNDHGIRHDDGGASMARRFAPNGPGPRFFPTSPTEALRMARPKVDGILGTGTVGAVAPLQQNDTYDWSWVRDD